MARIKLLIDTDIFIDYLKGMSPAKVVFRSKDIDIYCSAWSKKLPLLTRNRRHFSYIEEIKLSPIYG